MTNRIYVGIKRSKEYDIFRSSITPTESEFGHIYIYVIGPFRTMAGARTMGRYGHGNPHLQSVHDAEKMVKFHPEMGAK